MNNIVSFVNNNKDGSVLNLGNNISYEETDDGGAVINLDSPEEKVDDLDFYENIIDVLDENEVQQAGVELLELIKKDKETQRPFFQSVSETIKLLGIGTGALEELTLDSKIETYSSALFQCLLECVASVEAVLFPSKGITKCFMVGDIDEFDKEEVDKNTQKIQNFYNYYLTKELKGFRREAIKNILWTFISGNSWKKVYIDPIKKRVVSRRIKIEDFIINREFPDYHEAPRKTHVLHLSDREFKIMCANGYFSEKFSPTFKDDFINSDLDDNLIQIEIDKVNGTERSGSIGFNNGGYVIFETHCDYLFKSDKKNTSGISVPYIISIDESTGRVVRVSRRWEDKSQDYKKLEYFVNFPYVPALDGDGYGLMHFGSSSAKTATLIDRLALQGALYNSFPGGIISSSVKLENNTIRPRPGEFVNASMGGLPPSQLVLPLPYKDPSPVLLQIKDNVENNIKRHMSIINDNFLSMAQQSPTGSVAMILENMQRVPNFILKEFFNSFSDELALMQKRFFELFENEEKREFVIQGGKFSVEKDDFSEKYVVVPFGDTESQSSVHNMMIAEVILSKANEAPNLHDLREGYRNFYKKLNLSDEQIDKIMLPVNKEEDLKPLDPISENANAILGKPNKAFIWQDHKAHIIAHKDVENMDAHIAEHTAMDYVIQMQSIAGFAIPENISELSPEEQNHIAMLQAQAVLEKQKEQQEQNPIPQPVDPGAAMLEDARLKAETAHEKLIFENKKLDLETQIKMRELEIEEAKLQIQVMIKEKELGMKADMEIIKNDTTNKKIDVDALLKEKDLLIKEKNKTDKFLKENNIEVANIPHDEQLGLTNTEPFLEND